MCCSPNRTDSLSKLVEAARIQDRYLAFGTPNEFDSMCHVLLHVGDLILASILLVNVLCGVFINKKALLGLANYHISSNYWSDDGHNSDLRHSEILNRVKYSVVYSVCTDILSKKRVCCQLGKQERNAGRAFGYKEPCVFIKSIDCVWKDIVGVNLL